MSERTSAMVNGALIALGALAILDNVVAHIQENTRGITRGALVSWKQAKSIMDALIRDAEALRAEGIMLSTIGVAHEGVLEGGRPGRVEIGVHSLTPAIAETLLQRYADPTIGRDKVVVVEKEQYASMQPPIPDMAEAVKNLKADPIMRDMAAEFLSQYRSGQYPAIPGWDGRQAGLLLNEYYRRGGQVETGIGGPTRVRRPGESTKMTG